MIIDGVLDAAREHGGDLGSSERRPRSLRRRTASRLAAVQTLFQTHDQKRVEKDLSLIMSEFKTHFLPALLEAFDIEGLNEGHYTSLVFSGCRDAGIIEAALLPLLRSDWTLERLGGVERSVIQAAFIELRDMPHVPARTVISEYTALADSCGGDSNFINAILDRFSHRYRGLEMSEAR